MRLLLPFPFLKVRRWRDASQPKEAKALEIRLRKFWSTKTPPKTLKNGETWGKGQVEIVTNQSEIYRGQIKEIRPYPGEVLATSDSGVILKFEFDWLARKLISFKFREWEMHVPIWRWELLRSVTLSFTILEFRQSKDFVRSGVLHPKRLLFRNNRGNTNQFCEGQFYQNHDPENLELRDGILIDPLKRD